MRGAEMPFWLILMLGALSAVGPLSTDMYLPAFPAVERSLGSGTGSAQITLAAWFAGLAVGQFSQGPASDRWGRRAPLVFGMVVYTLGSIGCALAADVWQFSACRFLAALGGSAGMVIPRAVVRDVSAGNQGARIMSQLMLVLGVVPILAPTLGGLVLSVASWRWIFWIAALYGVVMTVVVVLALPDTLPRASRLHLSPVQVLGRYLDIVREKVFLSNSCICGFGTFVIFAYLAGTPVVFERILHFSPTGFGAMFGINAFFYILGTQINARVVTRVGAVRMMTGGLYSLTAGAAALILAAISGLAGPHGPLLATVLPVMWVMASLGFVSPNATILALGAHARHAGSASALLGTIQFSLGALSGMVMGIFSAVSILPMAFVILAGVAGAALADIARKAASEADHGSANA
ncbi:MAG: multidrug effflux MFS transporter [Gluconacetobacter diazotrophicus]|nr:multidrug effflux MFS transporter [Gluconacetobacter diazotrophicus]